MKKGLILFLAILLSFPTVMASTAPVASTNTMKTGDSIVVAQRKRGSKKKNAKRKVRRKKRKLRRQNELTIALSMARKGQFEEASKKLFRLSLSPKYKSQRNQIKYILGMMLYQMKLYQLSAFQFISVLKKSERKYLRQSLEKLSLAADELGDDTLLNYAISRVKVEKFPKSSRDMLYFRIGEYQMRAGDYKSAARSFGRVKRTSIKFSKAKYLQGLAFAELNNGNKAVETFQDLYDSRANKDVTDPARVSALVGIARTYYQKRSWDKALEHYRDVPRDTEAWHDTLFESSWAMLRSGRFRSALSNFQTIHSSFYERFYLPESLLLRSIVYLYICKYEEMEKVLNLFTNIYKPVLKKVKDQLKNVSNSVKFYDEVSAMMAEFIEKGEDMDASKYEIPFIIGRRIYKEGDFQRSFQYIKKLENELNIVKSQANEWKDAAIGRYATRVLNTRIEKAKKKAGRQLRRHLITSQTELFDLFEQEGFIRFEMINGKKELIKKRVAGKDLPKTSQIVEETERDYFVQNGYQYWPFQGEYWLDELGNYHYVGTQSCE